MEEFPEQQDVLRYVLTANSPELKDNDFTWKDFQSRNNNELVAIYGNFINRVVVLINKYYNGAIPKSENLLDDDIKVLAEINTIPLKIKSSIEKFRFREGLKELMNIARIGNKYLADQEPWKLIKTSPERVATILNTSIQITGILSYLSEPFLPETSKKLQKLLKIEILNWKGIENKSIFNEGHVINKQELLFSKIEDSEIKKQIDKLQKNQSD